MSNSTYLRIQRFDWTSEDEATEIHFYVSLIHLRIATGELVPERLTVAMSEDDALYMIEHREYNVDHVRLMSDEHFHRPILAVLMPDGVTLIIDGTHRYLAHFMRRVNTIEMKRLSYEDVRPYLKLKGKPL